ncbi:hypothetical protein SPB21_13630 [Leptothoe sp. ISB3NOV94-8A]
MSLSSRLKKKLKTKFKKQRSKTKGPTPNKKRTKPRDSKPDSPNRKPDSDPKTLTPADRQTLIRDIDNDIRTAQKLPPADASKLLRAAHTLKRGLLDLDAKRNNNNNQTDPEKKDKDKDTNPTDLKKARNELTQAKNNLQDTATNIRESAIATAIAIKKKPEDMSADDISDAINAVEDAIKDGQTNLLPADASKWQRAMYALKMALFELADVDPRLAVKDKENLKKLIKTKQANTTTDPATSAKVRKAIADANKVQADIPLRQTARQPQKPPGNQDLEKLKNKQPEDMTADEIIQAIAAVDNAIEKGQTDLLPADASKWQKVLRTLQLALFELGGVAPDLAVKDRDQLIDQIATKQGQPLTDDTRDKIEQAIADVNRIQSDINNRPPTPIDYKALEKLKDTPPEDMTADDIIQAIAAVDKAIEEGKADLLPADTSKWQKVLRALQLALYELGGVDPDLTVQNKDELIDLIITKQGKPPTDDTREKVKQAIADMARVQSDITKRNTNTSDYPALDVLRQKKIEDLSPEEARAAINDIDRSIKDSKVLLPENSSKLLRALYALKMALLNLGNVNPRLRYEIKEHLETILKEQKSII